MKILITDSVDNWEREILKNGLSDHDVTYLSESLTAEVAVRYPDTEILSVFVTSPVPSEVMNLFPNLQYIATRSTGFNHIDLETAKEKRIQVSNVPFYGENTVAEHAMALILSLARKLPESFKRIKEGKFDYLGLQGWDLKGKTVGVIGGGHIGMHFVRMALGFEMNVLVFDVRPDEALSKKLGFEYVELDDLYARSDIISLHVPLNPHTEHIINAEALDKMKDGVYLINTARGGLIETDALVEALQSGKVAGAGLDVLEGEELLTDELEMIGMPEYKEKLLTMLENHILMEMENVVVTPHNAFNSNEAVTRILTTTIDNIHSFESGETKNLVSYT